MTFPLFAKLEVNGETAHPLYQWLKGETGAKDISWNFEKFLIGRDGSVIGRFEHSTPPDDPAVIKALEAELAKK